MRAIDPVLLNDLRIDLKDVCLVEIDAEVKLLHWFLRDASVKLLSFDELALEDSG